jgi:hypothetical protein
VISYSPSLAARVVQPLRALFQLRQLSSLLMIELRWPDGKVKCPRCGSERIFYIEKERVWKCYGKHDQAKFSLVGIPPG